MRRPHRLLSAPLLSLALVGGVVSGCGGDSGGDGGDAAEPAAEEVDPQDAECREQWRALTEEVGDRPDDERPSGLAGRWTSIAATIDYYAVSASASDCEKTLEQQGEQIEALTEFGSSLRRYDVQFQHDRLAEDAAAYSPPRKRDGAPAKAQVRKALDTLEQRAPRAERDQEAGWQQATVVELDDRKSRRKAQRDLAFLSEESAAWRQAQKAQRTIQRGLRAADR